MDPMAAIRDTFFQECSEQLAEVEAGLEAMNSGVADAETVNAVFRAVHSIKGGAGAFQLDRLVRFAHVFETTLDGIRCGRLNPTDALIKIMLRSKDALSDLVEFSRAGGAIDERRIESLTEELTLACAASGEAEPDDVAEIDFQPVTLSIDDLPLDGQSGSDERSYAITFAPRRDLYRRGNEPARLLRELGSLGEIAAVCDVSAVPCLEGLDPEDSYLTWSIDLKTDSGVEAIQEVFDFVIGDCDLAIVPGGHLIHHHLETAATEADGSSPQTAVASTPQELQAAAGRLPAWERARRRPISGRPAKA